MRLDYNGSRPRYACIDIQGVPTQGVIDSGSDITIIGGELFRKVAAVARLRKKDLRKPDRVPRTYDNTPFALDAMADLDLTFGDVTLKTPVYIKIDGTLRGRCYQSGIISFHPAVLGKSGGTTNLRGGVGKSGPEKSRRSQRTWSRRENAGSNILAERRRRLQSTQFSWYSETGTERRRRLRPNSVQMVLRHREKNTPGHSVQTVIRDRYGEKETTVHPVQLVLRDRHGKKEETPVHSVQIVL